MEYQEGQVLFGRYRISGAVKKGGMGAVYRAVDLQFPGRGTLALKEMLADIPQDEIRKIVQEKFEEEARVLVQLSHQGIPRVWDHFVSGDLHYIVMEFIEGESLDEVLRDYLSLTGAPVPPARAVDFGVQLCDILEYLHTRPGHPILHRDLKPGNIIVRKEAPRVVLVDFGLARGVNPLSFSTRTAVGTLGYAPLEQLRGQPDVRSDLYSLGATLHHLVGGQVPVPFEIPCMQRVLPSVHPNLAAVIDRAVAQEPRQRFQTAIEFRQALQDVQRQLEVPGEGSAGARRPAKTGRAQPAVPDPPTPRPTREPSASRRGQPAPLLPWEDEPGESRQGATVERRAGANPVRRPAKRFSRQALALGVVACTAIALLTVFYHMVLVPSGALGPSSTAGTDNGTGPPRAAQASGPPSMTAIDATSRPVAPPAPESCPGGHPNPSHAPQADTPGAKFIGADPDGRCPGNHSGHAGRGQDRVRRGAVPCNPASRGGRADTSACISPDSWTSPHGDPSVPRSQGPFHLQCGHRLSPGPARARRGGSLRGCQGPRCHLFREDHAHEEQPQVGSGGSRSGPESVRRDHPARCQGKAGHGARPLVQARRDDRGTKIPRDPSPCPGAGRRVPAPDVPVQSGEHRGTRTRLQDVPHPLPVPLIQRQWIPGPVESIPTISSPTSA